MSNLALKLVVDNLAKTENELHNKKDSKTIKFLGHTYVRTEKFEEIKELTEECLGMVSIIGLGIVLFVIASLVM